MSCFLLGVGIYYSASVVDIWFCFLVFHAIAPPAYVYGSSDPLAKSASVNISSGGAVSALFSVIPRFLRYQSTRFAVVQCADLKLLVNWLTVTLTQINLQGKSARSTACASVGHCLSYDSVFRLSTESVPDCVRAIVCNLPCLGLRFFSDGPVGRSTGSGSESVLDILWF